MKNINAMRLGGRSILGRGKASLVVLERLLAV